MNRVAQLVSKIGNKLEDIHVTLDSHRVVDVGHPVYWKGKDGTHPLPFTMITATDIENGTWTPTNPAWYNDQLQSAKKRETEGKKPNMVWPPHCLIGTWGHNVQIELMDALMHWETENFANVNYKTKGSYPHREHYGGMEAEDPDPREPSTSLDMRFIAMLSEADMILFTGEALSHCVMSTLNQVADNILNAISLTQLKLVNHNIWKYNFGVFTTKKFITSHYHILYLVKPGMDPIFNTYCRYSAQDKTDSGRSVLYFDMEDVWTQSIVSIKLAKYGTRMSYLRDC